MMLQRREKRAKDGAKAQSKLRADSIRKDDDGSENRNRRMQSERDNNRLTNLRMISQISKVAGNVNRQNNLGREITMQSA